MQQIKKITKLEEAKSYISYCIKEGCGDPADFEGMTDKELVEWAEYNAGKAEVYANDSERNNNS